MRKRNLKFIPTIFLFSFLIAFPSFAQPHITVGIQDSIQQEILGQIVGTYLEEKGFKVKYKMSLSNSSLYSALTKKEVDLAWQDPASVWFLKFLRTDILSSKKLYKEVKELEENKGLLWFKIANLENQYVPVMQRKKSEKLEITTISELADCVRKDEKKIRVVMSSEFFFRPDCYFDLKQIYGFSFYRPNVRLISSTIGFGLLSGDQVDVVFAFSTDPPIEKLNLIKLKDDKKALKSYCMGIVIREEIMDRFSDLSSLVEKLIRISPATSEIARLNLKVYNGVSSKEVAREYLREKGLIDIKRE
ncbi:MAG: glycine betaine ABC transporter substrate-binding protein [Candidatus Aerophobetes bacterium]|nr:glycine betaine ABC transporter substrate-binding protein [Candidatus Aerophobetes bacterium]